jgi:hypothetical protein
MSRTLCTTMALLALVGCDPTGPDDDDDEFEFPLVVTARSATTLSLEWSSMGGSNTYTVDYLTGVGECQDFPAHNDGVHVSGTSVRLTGLVPATRYHIHVHLLPHGQSGEGTGTNIVYVSTLAAGAGEQPVAASDYEACNHRIGA